MAYVINPSGCQTTSLDTEKRCDCKEEEEEITWLRHLKEKTSLLHEEMVKKSIRSKSYITNNGDIQRIPRYVANFSKTLPHDKKGFVDQHEYRKLLDFCHGNFSKLQEINLGGVRKLKNPSCIYTIDLCGLPKDSYYLPASPSITSKDAAADMVELYAMALARDIPFSQWHKSKEIKRLAKQISKLTSYWGPRIKDRVTPDCIFRGETKADLKGQFVSQFLYQDIIQGAQRVKQKIYPYIEGKDYLTKYKEIKEVQNGTIPIEPTDASRKSRYIITIRDGATYVHNDYPGQCAQAAVQMLLSLKCPIKPQNQESKECYFNDLNMVDIYDLIFRSVKLGMCAAWHHKYHQLKLRPEAFAMLVDQAKKEGCNPYHLDKELLESSILEQVKERWHSYCLPQCFKEASPEHPSYPSGHATWAGAAITIIKAFFDNDFKFEAYGPNEDGSRLIPLGYYVKVGDELDKLGSNIATFRNVSGVHYRSDMLGLYLGEAVAIEILQEAVKRYAYPVTFKFRSRRGKEIVISNRC